RIHLRQLPGRHRPLRAALPPARPFARGGPGPRRVVPVPRRLPVVRGSARRGGQPREGGGARPPRRDPRTGRRVDGFNAELAEIRRERRERFGYPAFLSFRCRYLSSVLCVLGALCALGVERAPTAGDVHAIVLGIAQDGGVPHIGCTQELCVAARRDPAKRQRVASLGLVDGERRFLIDATPDLASQLESLNADRAVPDRARPVDGILLTHAHMGHYLGLLYLGREALGARAVLVHATPRMARFLRENGPWSQLV